MNHSEKNIALRHLYHHETELVDVESCGQCQHALTYVTDYDNRIKRAMFLQVISARALSALDVSTNLQEDATRLREYSRTVRMESAQKREERSRQVRPSGKRLSTPPHHPVLTALFPRLLNGAGISISYKLLPPIGSPDDV